MSKAIWNSENIPDQSGRIVIVTGASSGIGFEAARALALKNAKVILAVRNLSKGNSAADKIKAQSSGADIVVMELDLAELDSIKSFADNFIKRFGVIDLLINNAGVMIPPYSKTKNGFELQFGTNHLGHFALTALLIKAIKNERASRIVNVSSNAHKAGNINFNDLHWEKRKYIAWKAYGDSKIANLYFTYELRKRLDKSDYNIITAASHPGWTATDLQRHSGLFRFLNPLFAQDVKIGALPTLYAAVAANVRNGDYFGPSGWQEWRGYPKKVGSNNLSQNEKIAAKLWDVSEKLTGIKFNLD